MKRFVAVLASLLAFAPAIQAAQLKGHARVEIVSSHEFGLESSHNGHNVRILGGRTAPNVAIVRSTQANVQLESVSLYQDVNFDAEAGAVLSLNQATIVTAHYE